MSILRLRIGEPGDRIRPCSSLEVEASWHLDGSDERVELNLLWHTRGRGSQDVEVVQSMELVSACPGASGGRSCTLRIPEGPCSFSGKLITLAWALELVALPSREVERMDLVVSPERDEIDIRSLREH